MRFFLLPLSITLACASVISDQTLSSQSISVDDSNDVQIPDSNDLTIESPLSSLDTNNNDVLASAGDLDFGSVTGSIFKAGIKYLGDSIDKLLNDVYWGGSVVAAILAGKNHANHPPKTKKEREEFLAERIRFAQEHGCAAANLGPEVCALRGEGRQFLPGLVTRVFDVYPAQDDQCVTPTVKPPTYCCATIEEWLPQVNVGVYCAYISGARVRGPTAPPPNNIGPPVTK